MNVNALNGAHVLLVIPIILPVNPFIYQFKEHACMNFDEELSRLISKAHVLVNNGQPVSLSFRMQHPHSCTPCWN